MLSKWSALAILALLATTEAKKKRRHANGARTCKPKVAQVYHSGDDQSTGTGAGSGGGNHSSGGGIQSAGDVFQSLPSTVPTSTISIVTSTSLSSLPTTSCFPATPVEGLVDRINAALNSTVNGPGYSLALCQDTQYNITSPILFAFANQEIITEGFPGPDFRHRAIINVNGPPMNHTTAVVGTCINCTGVALRYVQLNGNRNGADVATGGALIEFGGDNSNQLIQGVRSHNTRSWSCLHVIQGEDLCQNATIRDSDIGPCGTDDFQQWADGISLACANSVVTNNTIIGATDGGIVIFASPGSHVYNNTIEAYLNVQLGAINLVDPEPYDSNYTGVIVEDNIIFGGFATSVDDASKQEGRNANDTFTKIGIAMGTRPWFGATYANYTNYGATVRNNVFQGAFGYAMAAADINGFTISGNVVASDTTFVGAVGPNCSVPLTQPPPTALVYNSSQIGDSVLQPGFKDVDADALLCLIPDPNDKYPYVFGKPIAPS